ncbi:hypothetical protein TPHA_0M01350 [Tetrapisispora phaffii CBS 4417]|uniref:Uncharacterized protein n=1 Tax=Tetrapisispora phaffii (strain ATCC 24235 / CBS 4417 / NBRC 1672 / NRRL Y-8282 / UCD 70-5) TaxID=1071381 RepID=G8C0J5_TETPH|nr:hypothetical protein TPHA_0M01350 [Tetrapisispora phaffii CBS 4417]CCE65710.1 hypothetical protein TPHA_0M01350 [Tetrapisispora phaffii CBS 4417]
MLNLEDYLFSSQEFYNPTEIDTNTLAFPTKLNGYKSYRYRDNIRSSHLISPIDMIFDNNEVAPLDASLRALPESSSSSSNDTELVNQLQYYNSEDCNSSVTSKTSQGSTNTLNIFDYPQVEPQSPFHTDDLTRSGSKESAYVKQPRQSRYNTTKEVLRSYSKRNDKINKSDLGIQDNIESNHTKRQRQKKVSDSRLSAHGLAEVLQLDSPEEALEREKNILDIFENELHYPLGYKTWVRDTKKEERMELMHELYNRVNCKYPHYNYNISILETIIRRATYYMMQSRLRRERRAKIKNVKDKRTVELV